MSDGRESAKKREKRSELGGEKEDRGKNPHRPRPAEINWEQERDRLIIHKIETSCPIRAGV